MLGAAAASARTIAAKVLIFAATTPSSSRLNIALVVAVGAETAETALLAWWLWRYEDDRMPSRFASCVDVGLQHAVCYS